MKVSPVKKLILDLYYLSLALFILTMPFPIQGNNLAMVFAVLCWMLLFFRKDCWKEFITLIKGNRTAVLLIIFSLLFVFSALVHYQSYDDLDIVLKNIEKRIHILVFPIILSRVVSLSRQRIRKLLMLFVYVMIFASVFCLIIGLITTLKTGTVVYVNPQDSTIGNNFLYHRLGSYIGMHAVFFASYICFAYCILLIKYLNDRPYLNRRSHLLYFLVLGFFTGMILLLQSIVISIVFLIVTAFIFLEHFYLRTQNKKAVIVSLIIILLAGIVFSYSIYDKLVVQENILSYDLSAWPDKAGSEGRNWNALNIRLAKWEIASKALKEYWLLGVGPGNMTEVLDSYYEKYDFRFGILNHFNPHNQFLHSFLVLGIVGLITLLLIVASIIKTSIKRRDLVLGSLLIIFLLFSLTASTLSVNKGIMFFSFFFSFLTYLPGGSTHIFVKDQETALPSKQ